MNTGARGRTERRLAAILATDVVAYSRLMGADEEGTLARLNAHRRELLDPKIAEHHGRIVKATGDGLLVEFASVVDAVRCAVEFQRGMAERNSNVGEVERLVFRVGINLGDVIVENDDIFGDGVNVAARLESLAEPGGVCISRTVRDQIRDRLPYAFVDMGQQTVKNIVRPVHVYALNAPAIAETTIVPTQPRPQLNRPLGRRLITLPASLGACLAGILVLVLAAWQVWSRAGPSPAGVQSTVLPLPSSARTPTAPNPPPRLSIVVLPFANLSNDPEQEYFTDGITDDLTTDLSRITDSFVIARTTAFAYKSKPVNVKQIGRDLGVRYILEGSVRRLGEQVQVNVQLIDAESGAHVWADRFDTDRTNLARAQGDIVSRLAQTLQVELLEAASRRIELEKPINPDARDFVMRGWAGWYRPETAAQLQEDMRLFERALELEPQSADAKVGIATVLIESVTVTWSKSREQDVARAEQLLTEALERDRNNPRLFWAMGLLRRLQNRLVDSKIAFENAIALDHNNAASMLQLGFTLDTLGQPEVALPYFEKAIRLNPRAQNIHFYHFGLGSCYLLQNQIDRAVDYLEKANASKPQYYIIPLYLSAALALNGKIPEAKAALADAIKLKPQIRSLAVLPKYNVGLSNPSYAALAAKTLYVGLRRAGLPDE